MIYSENSYDKITTTTITANKEGALSMCSMRSGLGTFYGEVLEQGELGSCFSFAPLINVFTDKPANFSEPQFLPPQMEMIKFSL